MNVTVTEYEEKDLPRLVEIWNEVVEQGMAFPQENLLTLNEGRDFFSSQSFTGAAKTEDGQVVGLYILHPNNVGRCGHQCNASYAVDTTLRGQKIGEKLVRHCLQQAAQIGYKLLIFNAVVEGNDRAIQLYEKLGFQRIGRVPGGFCAKDGMHDTFMYYHTL